MKMATEPAALHPKAVPPPYGTPLMDQSSNAPAATQVLLDLRCALARAGIHLPGLHIDHGCPGQRPLLILGHAEMGDAAKLVKILNAVGRP
ncbi:hypothetical protein [Streptomyces vinaceus]|uniref:hypothetical protein n=1 Tax=Streptomyces vinaceus TaxID=1960 RepID=UPI003680B598